MAECADTTTSDAIAEARRIHLEKLTRVQDSAIKVVPRTDATTRPLTGRWADIMQDDGARKARWTTRGYEQTLNENEAPAMMHVTMMLVEAAPIGHVAAIGDCSGVCHQSLLNPDGTEGQVWIEGGHRGGGDRTKYGKPCLPVTQGCTESVGHVQCERSHEFHGNGTITTRRLLVLPF